MKNFELIQDSDFKVGDRVEIVQNGKIYSTYKDAFQAIGFKNKKENICKDGDQGTIFHICQHPDKNIIMLSINLDNGNQVLINKEGVKLVSRYEFKKGDWVVVLPEDGHYHNAEKGKAQCITGIDYILPYSLRFRNGRRNTYSKVRQATSQEIQETINYFISKGKMLDEDINLVDIPKKFSVQVNSLEEFRIALDYFGSRFKNISGEHHQTYCPYNYPYFIGIKREKEEAYYNNEILEDSAEELLSFKQFETYILPGLKQELPKEYIIECSTEEETNIAAEFFKKKKGNYNFFEYVYVSPKFHVGNILWRYNINEVLDLPIIPFPLWNSLITNTKNTEPIMEKEFKITRTSLRELHSIACQGWKSKLEQYALRTPMEDIITFSYKEVEEMFSAATTSQMETVKKVFPNFDKELDLESLKKDLPHFMERDPAMIQVRQSGEYDNKGYFLSPEFNWKIVIDSRGYQVLVPSLKH